MYDPARANALNGNPLKSRADLQKALLDLFDPLLPYFSEGGARVRLSAAGAIFDHAAADLEGFARPLWGIVPFVAGGGTFPHWDLYRKGLANGTDPDHPEYWGDVGDRNQRLVELAAIGFALALVPDHVFEPLEPSAKRRIEAYLLAARDRDYVDNNWKFFRVLVDLGLTRIGASYDRSKTEAYLDELEAFDIGDGWYRDGPVRRVDHYIPFAMHFYGLIYATLCKDDPSRNERLLARAKRFAPDIRHWYGPDGAALAFGRSQTYRFAAGGFWAALAFADLEALPWGEIKGYYLRHIRYWSQLPIADRDRVLSVGYGYPNLLMSESYNSAGSPYWALKFFLALALPEDHPFWLAEEANAPVFDDAVPLEKPGMVAMHTQGNIVVLASGQEHDKMRGSNEKYAKFVYSTRYTFNIEANDRHFDAASFDGMLGLSDDGVHFRMRETLDEALIAGSALFSRWRPYADVVIETYLLPAAPWHIRLHKVQTPRPLMTIEGGFAIARADFARDTSQSESGRAVWFGKEDVTAIVDLAADKREGRAHLPIANTNLLHARTILPQLRGTIPAGETILVTAACALPRSAGMGFLDNPPPAPDPTALETLFRQTGRRVAAFDIG
ncbi:DUF2264 domain-containing protein [Rhizobium sp. SSA_523]|uniref:DUF2264 domain-containing protein n=1 Tax=Rhizobium sp. SSA_523 TaxID=2952477 RepID=UPI0020918A65|nr:DUF2264 domain-containing protein [Rhizobium sp. SSA_523]MCO5732331.1 DUF2264 domain-containing protein [Rhizobium sp. SSA_523]WKC21267.1 DUF2264 domain-containing protein [Rhizobium sp. SSA_523]